VNPRRTVSLCLIVRDEAEHLSACVESARDAIDEIVVVDTGSTDDTVAIARDLGARVRHFDWCDSFAAARNASIDAASGDFVLIVDADERLDADAPRVVRRLVEAEPADAAPTLYLPLIVNLDARGRHLGADRMPRLWRNRPALRFVGRIHERIGARAKMAYEDGFRILHLGYDPELVRKRGKRGRNRTLLDAELAESPDDPTLHFYLAKELYAAGDDESALAHFRRVIDDGTALNLALSSHVFAAECLRTLERPTEALALATSGLGANPTYGALWFVAGQAALDLDRADAALDAFQRATLAPEGIAALAFRDPSIEEWRASLGLARALLLAGEIGAGVQRLAELPAVAADEALPVLLQVAEALMAHGDPSGAASVLALARTISDR